MFDPYSAGALIICDVLVVVAVATVAIAAVGGSGGDD
jgi:hypothetical protein